MKINEKHLYFLLIAIILGLGTCKAQFFKYATIYSSGSGNTAILEILQKTKSSKKIYNLNGKEIYRRENVYIENGKINFKIK